MEQVTDFAFREMVARYGGQVKSGKLKVKSGSTTPSRCASHPSFAFIKASKKEGSAPRLSSNILRSSPPLIGGVPAEGGGGGNNFVTFTEFINVDGLTHPEGRKNLSIDLKYSEAQRPIVAQLWGRDPEKFKEAARIIRDLKFDGIDINMGCPQQKEIAGGTCAALIREPKLAWEIISATKEGWLSGQSVQSPTTPSRSAGHPSLTGGEAPQLSPLSDKVRSSPPFQGGVPRAKPRGEVVLVPISVKTRIGYSKTSEMEKWVENLLAMDIAALILHGRTKQEMSKVPAHWDKIAEAVNIRAKVLGLRAKTLIIGNGDIKSREEGLARVAETGCDGVMIGRGAFGHPWVFRDDNYQTDIKERLRVMLEHAELFDRELGKNKSFAIMRKHFKAYCSGFAGAHELRAKLMQTKNLDETRQIIGDYLSRASF